jgi:hypothetical protein
VATVMRVLGSKSLVDLRRQDKKKPTEHLRIRYQITLTRSEISDVTAELSKIPGYTRYEVKNATWQDRWFKTTAGVEMRLFFK